MPASCEKMEADLAVIGEKKVKSLPSGEVSDAHTTQTQSILSNAVYYSFHIQAHCNRMCRVIRGTYKFIFYRIPSCVQYNE